MILYVVMIFILALWKCKVRPFSNFDNYLSKESCDAIKGICILLIFASHFSAYVDSYAAPLDVQYWKIRVALGQCVVAPFLFFSGYGTTLSILHKRGGGYLEDFPRKRMLPTLLIYSTTQIFFLLLQLSRGRTYTVGDFFCSAFAWESFGNDNWYIFVIVALYGISYLSFKYASRPQSAAAAVSLGSVALILFLICAGKGRYWFNTILCYPAGVWYTLYQSDIDAWSEKNQYYVPMLVVTGILFCLFHKLWEESHLYYELTAVFFILTVVLLLRKVQITNPVLQYCGRHLQGLFLLHRIPMIFLSDGFWGIKNNRYLYFAVSVAVAFVLDFVFTKFLSFMRKQESTKMIA